MTEEIVYAQLHCHSRQSINPLSGEGAFHRFLWPLERQIMRLIMMTPNGLLRLARKEGVDFIAITDHNTVPTINDKSGSTITAEEWGQRKGHCNFIDLKESIDPECGYFKSRAPDEPRDFRSAAAEARKQGAFVSINHPFKSDSWEWGKESYALADAMEVWNGPWCEENQKALDQWQQLLLGGRRILCMAGNDFHVNRLFSIGSQVAAYRGVASKSELMKRLKSGDYSLARNTKSPIVFPGKGFSYRIEKYREPLELRIVSSNRVDSLSNPGEDGPIDRDALQGFVRFELWNGDGPLSFSNPVFI